MKLPIKLLFSTDDPRMPDAGEIVFGDHTMTWGYPEQRVITSLIALPVPFSVTSNAPIKVAKLSNH